VFVLCYGQEKVNIYFLRPIIYVVLASENL
jgi:hypothetical protein